MFQQYKELDELFERDATIVREKLKQSMEQMMASVNKRTRSLKAQSTALKVLLAFFVFASLIQAAQSERSSICDSVGQSATALTLKFPGGVQLILNTLELMQMCVSMCCQALLEANLELGLGFQFNATTAAPAGPYKMLDCYDMGEHGMMRIYTLASAVLQNVSQVSQVVNMVFEGMSYKQRFDSEASAPAVDSYKSQWAAATTFAVLFGVGLAGIAGRKLYQHYSGRLTYTKLSSADDHDNGTL